MTEKPSIADYNREAWDNLVSKGNVWTQAVSPEDIAAARNGNWKIVLTPTKHVPRDWMGDVSGKDVLCLAGGGGQQSPLLAAAGATVTTLDNSPSQLAQDTMVAEREGLQIRTLLGTMDDLSILDDQSFDLIVHPCSNSYTRDVLPVWRESYRVLRPQGHLISGFCNPFIFVFDYGEELKGNLVVKHKIPYSDELDLDPAVKQKLIDDGEPLSFGHSLNDQIGGQIAAGFVLTGFYEDNWNSEDSPISDFIDGFIATRATRMP